MDVHRWECNRAVPGDWAHCLDRARSGRSARDVRCPRRSTRRRKNTTDSDSECEQDGEYPSTTGNDSKPHCAHKCVFYGCAGPDYNDSPGGERRIGSNDCDDRPEPGVSRSFRSDASALHTTTQPELSNPCIHLAGDQVPQSLQPLSTTNLVTDRITSWWKSRHGSYDRSNEGLSRPARSFRVPKGQEWSRYPGALDN